MKITRRKALAVGAAAIVSPFAIAQGSFIESPIEEPIKATEKPELPDLHVYEIDDGVFWGQSDYGYSFNGDYWNIPNLKRL